MTCFCFMRCPLLGMFPGKPTMKMGLTRTLLCFVSVRSHSSRPSHDTIRDPETSVLTVGVRPLRQETIACHSFTCVNLTLCCNFSVALTATTRNRQASNTPIDFLSIGPAFLGAYPLRLPANGLGVLAIHARAYLCIKL